MPPKKHLAVEGKAGPSRGSARGSSRGAPTVRAPSSGASSRGASSSAASIRGASSRGARGGRRPAGRGRRRAASYSGGNMGDTFLGKLTQNPGMMGEFMKFYDTLAKALDKRDKKKTAHRLGFGGDDDDDDGDDDDDEDNEDSGEESPGDDLDGFTRRTLAGMAAKMGGVSDLKLSDGTPLDFSSDDDDDSDEDHEMEEVLFAMGNDTEESSSSEDEAEPASPAAARIKYVRFHDAEFAAAVAAATRIARLSLAKLMRTRKEDEMFGDVKKAKHIEAVLKALGNGTKDVAALHLEDAKWATCKIYAPMLVKLLASYRDNLRTLSLTNRLLLQPNNGKKKDCIWKVVSSMPHLEELRLTYVALSLHYFTYRGELRQDDGYGFATTTKAKQAPPVLPALKRIHLHLTPDWFERQFRAAIDDSSDYEDFEYESAGGGEREEEQEDFLVDLLASKGDAVTLLDMTCVQKTRMELEIVDLLAGLHNVLSIGLRVELLRVTKEMARLESAVVAFHHDPAPEDDAVAEAAAVIAAAPASWVGLKALTLRVPSEAASSMALFARAAPKRVRKVQASWNQVLTAAAGVCCSLKSLTLEGSGWGADALQQVLAKNPLLEEVVLDESAALEPRHLALLKDLAALKRVQLSPALRDAAEGTELAALVAQCQQQWAGRSVGVQWGKKTAGRA